MYELAIVQSKVRSKATSRNFQQNNSDLQHAGTRIQAHVNVPFQIPTQLLKDSKTMQISWSLVTYPPYTEGNQS
jgi:hypothetical protein